MPFANHATLAAIVVFAASFGVLYDSRSDGASGPCGQKPVDLLGALAREVPAPHQVLISLGYNVCLDREL